MFKRKTQLTVRLFMLPMLLSSANMMAAGSGVVTLAVVHERDDEPTVARWNLLADYLSAHIPGTVFRVVTLARSQFPLALDQQRVDFLITSGAHYAELEAKHGVSRIASMEYILDGRQYSYYGAVIFARQDRRDIQSLEDIRGKTLAAAQPNVFGGYIAAIAELQSLSLLPSRDFTVRFTGQPVSLTAFAVRDGRMDVGTMRAESFELLAREGVIRKQDFRVLNPQVGGNFPVLRSTQLYPSWPISKAPHTSLDLAEHVATVLMTMSADDPAVRSVGINGWTIPLDYQLIHKVLRNLQLPPYDYPQAKTVSLGEYQPWMFTLIALVILLAGSSSILAVGNRRLRATEEKLRHHRSQLSDLIQQTTVELVAVRNMATSANSAKTRFLANITHDLQPPLNSIISFSGLLKQRLARCGLVTEAMDADKIMSASRKLLNLISDILDISRVEEGRVELHPVTFHLTEVVTDVIKSVKLIADEQHNTIKTVIDDGVGTIRNDVVHFKQILFNVLKDTCENSKNGVITLTIHRFQSTLDDQIVLAIRNSSSRVSPLDQENAFEPFYRFFNLSESDLSANGLGISISRAYCELMGGEIRLINTPGVGTEVWIKLPAEIGNIRRSNRNNRSDHRPTDGERIMADVSL